MAKRCLHSRFVQGDPMTCHQLGEACSSSLLDVADAVRVAPTNRYYRVRGEVPVQERALSIVELAAVTVEECLSQMGTPPPRPEVQARNVERRLLPPGVGEVDDPHNPVVVTQPVVRLVVAVARHPGLRWQISQETGMCPRKRGLLAAEKPLHSVEHSLHPAHHSGVRSTRLVSGGPRLMDAQQQLARSAMQIRIEPVTAAPGDGT